MELCCVKVSLAVICESCNNAVPVNGITEKVKCDHCQEKIILSNKYSWPKILNYHNPSVDIFTATKKQKPGAGDYGAWISVKLNTNRLWPECSKCKCKFTQADIEKAMQGEKVLICSKCNKTNKLKEVPEYFKKQFPSVLYSIDNLTSTESVNSKVMEGNNLIQMECKNCGASLQIDGSVRLVDCEFCHSKFYLPDDLWLSLHPQAKREQWFILFDLEKIQGNGGKHFLS